ncbi:MAG: hypothetical protein ABIQ39_14050 [Ilumatobacteraceae bacterium]
MAAPQFAPVSPIDDVRGYESAPYVPDTWMPDRPGEIRSFQPLGPQLGRPGPDIGYALKLARLLSDRVHLQPGERLDAAVGGCVGIAMRRAAGLGRAPTVYDMTVAFTIWGFFDEAPPADLVLARLVAFDGLEDVAGHYEQARQLVDQVPEATLRLTPQQVAAAYPDRWMELTGAT